MPEAAKSLKTPDPALTTEAFVAYIAAALSAAVVLFKLDLSDAQQAAAITIIGGLLTIAIPFAAAIIRKGRAQGGGLVTFLAAEVGEPVPGSDPGDVPPARLR